MVCFWPTAPFKGCDNNCDNKAECSRVQGTCLFYNSCLSMWFSIWTVTGVIHIHVHVQCHYTVDRCSANNDIHIG